LSVSLLFFLSLSFLLCVLYTTFGVESTASASGLFLVQSAPRKFIGSIAKLKEKGLLARYVSRRRVVFRLGSSFGSSRVAENDIEAIKMISALLSLLLSLSLSSQPSTQPPISKNRGGEENNNSRDSGRSLPFRSHIELDVV